LKTNKLSRKVVKNKNLVMDLGDLHRFQAWLFQIVRHRTKISREPKRLSPGPPEPSIPTHLATETKCKEFAEIACKLRGEISEGNEAGS
jgi:hypothetical protein